MRRRVFVVTGEYGSNPRFLSTERRSTDFLSEPAPELEAAELARLFFRYPNRSDDGRARPADWERDFGLSEPLTLTDLLASAGHRALSSLHALLGDRSYRGTLDRVTDLFVTCMPGLDPNERMNVGLVPQTLQATLQLSRRARCQFLAGTSDSGAWAFAQAVRAARSAERGATVLVVAGQIIPSGYASQYQIRTVLGDLDQARGLDMLVVGDLLMDCMRRNLGMSRKAVEAALSSISMRKFQAAGAYPAAMLSGRLPRRSTRRTPYFDGDDIAAPCCGAAATLVTSDEELVAQVLARRSPRHAGSPVMEVLGVGEGSSNPSFLERQSPVLFATAIREAFAATADDAGVRPATFPGAGFAVVHDAFPSIELAFLLGMGLDWLRAVERIHDGWSNPYGGLLTFGHALGASGLVQVNKTQHIFSGDRRHLRPIPQGPGPLPGTLAFTTSVGGPLSHIVVSLFRGGDGEAPQAARRSPSAEWVDRRRRLRRALPVHLARVERTLAGRARPVLVEGTTYVSIRSCLRALRPEDISGLTFDGIESLVRPDRLDEVRVRLRSLVSLVVGEAERLSSLFDVFRVLTDELVAMGEEWRQASWFSAEAAAMPPARLTERLKECLRVPLAVLCVREPGGRVRRVVQFLPRNGLGYEALDAVDLLLEQGGELRPLEGADVALLLPWWNVHARRRAEPPAPIGTGADRLEALLGAGGESVDETPADLILLREWSLPEARPWATELGAAASARPQLRAVAYVAQVVPPSPDRLAAAQEALAEAAREAQGWLGGWRVAFAQAGNRLWMTGGSAGATGATDVLRFAREVARATAVSGVRVRAALATGTGMLFDDVHGRPAVASDVTARAIEALGVLDRSIPAGAPGPGAVLALTMAEVDGPLGEAETSGWHTAATTEGVRLFVLD
ncbi:MAG TPA: hypothetical protein VGG91_06415 [Myxococcaceae bacterium]